MLLCENLDPDLDVNVLNLIFNPERFPKLEAVDCKLFLLPLLNYLVCGSSQASFVQAFEGMLLSHIDPMTGELLRPFPPIQRLSLHGCQTLPSNIYPHLVSALPGLTHLVYIAVTGVPLTHSIGSQLYTNQLSRITIHQSS